MKIYKITDLLVTALESITAKEKQNGKIKKKVVSLSNQGWVY